MVLSLDESNLRETHHKTLNECSTQLGEDLLAKFVRLAGRVVTEDGFLDGLDTSNQTRVGDAFLSAH